MASGAALCVTGNHDEKLLRALSGKAVKALHPTVPIIGFPKGSGEKLAAYARETGVDAVGIDETIDPIWAARELPANMPVQGNLDPLLLLAGGDELEARAIGVLEEMAACAHAGQEPPKSLSAAARKVAYDLHDIVASMDALERALREQEKDALGSDARASMHPVERRQGGE